MAKTIDLTERLALQRLKNEAARELAKLEALTGHSLPYPEDLARIEPSSGDKVVGRIAPKTDYTAQELYRLTAGFVDPEPPTSEQRELFEQGELEL